MAKLSILGAQRVKALQEILVTKQAQAINKLEMPSAEEISKLVDIEYGVDGWQEELDKLVKQAQALAEKINVATGRELSVSKNERYGYSIRDTAYKERKRELHQQLRDSKISEVKALYKQKSNMLWLCETLEEAKEIVGI